MSELHEGDLEPTGVTYVMEDVVRLEFKLGRTTLVLSGPQAEEDNARILIESAKDLFVQAVEQEVEKVGTLVSESEAEYDDAGWLG